MITILLLLCLSIVLVLAFFVSIVNILGWLAIGLIGGWLAGFFLPGRPKVVLWQTLALGIVGSVIGALLGSLLDVEVGFLGSIILSAAVLYGWVKLNPVA